MYETYILNKDGSFAIHITFRSFITSGTVPAGGGGAGRGGGGRFAVFVDPIHITFGSFTTSGTGPAGGGGAGGGGGGGAPRSL